MGGNEWDSTAAMRVSLVLNVESRGSTQRRQEGHLLSYLTVPYPPATGAEILMTPLALLGLKIEGLRAATVFQQRLLAIWILEISLLRRLRVGGRQ